MRYEIIFAPEAIEDLKALNGHERALVLKSLERHLRHEPSKISKSRIKRLRGTLQPQYRLRVDDIRIFYDIAGGQVQVLAVVHKRKSNEWLKEFGEFE